MRWLLVFFGVFVLGSDVAAVPACSHVDMDWLSLQAPLPENAKIVYKKDLGGVCEIVLSLDGDLVPLYAGEDFLLAGKLFKNKKFITGETLDALKDVAEKERLEADEKKALARESRKVFFQKNLNILQELTLFSFKPGKADTFLYVVTDPNCSYCKKLMPDLEILAMERHLEIRVVLFPVLGPKSRDMAARAICESYSYEDYGQIQFRPEPSGCDSADLYLEKAMPFFSRANLSFVPVVISGDGSWMVEGNNIAQVKQHLGIDCDGSTDNSSNGCAPVPEE
jgi:thiol:disulfide interchange protein DsbC